jgi:TRAP-type C4-dicarboxylate transport system permease small subunit
MTKKANKAVAIVYSAITKTIGYLDRFLLGAGGIAVVLIMTIATVNVIMRLFSEPLRGAYEIIAYLGAVAVAAALGYTQRRKDHIVVDILTDKYARIPRRIVDTISYLIMTVFFFAVTKALFGWGMSLADSGEVSETLKIVYHPFVFCVSTGFAMLAVTCFADTLKTALNIKNGDSE